MRIDPPPPWAAKGCSGSRCRSRRKEGNCRPATTFLDSPRSPRLLGNTPATGISQPEWASRYLVRVVVFACVVSQPGSDMPSLV